MPVYPSGGTIAQSVGSPGFGPAPAPVFNASASVRFNPADTPSFGYIPTVAGNRQTFTLSVWVKRSLLGAQQTIFGVNADANNHLFFEFQANDTLRIASNTASSTVIQLITTQFFRDPSQWYNIVFVFDLLNSTQADRVRLFVNGVRVTAFSTNTLPANITTITTVNASGIQHYIGRYAAASSFYFGGYFADMNFVDGLALTPSSFTATDANTGQLVPAQYTGAFGINGFYLPLSSAALAVDLGQNPKTTGQDYPYWKNNTLLVDTTNTNGQQNNSFSDSSQFGIGITRNGNTTQGTVSPFYLGSGTEQANGYYSGVFDGTGDYLTAPNSTFYSFSADFTVQCWVNPSTVTGVMASYWTPGTATASSWILSTSSSFLVFTYGIGSTNANLTATTGAIPLNAWSHVAVSRSGSTLRLFVNGRIVLSTTLSGALNNVPSNPLNIGRIQDGSGSFKGYISNLQIVTGTALYTANFTVPTTPLTATVNTSLLTCNSSVFSDSSTNDFAITPVGQAQPVQNNPFGMTAWSGYFDGTGDYLQTPTNAALSAGTGAFTIELFAYFNSVPAGGVGAALVGQMIDLSATNGINIYTSSNALRVAIQTYNTAAVTFTTTFTLTAQVWCHIVLVRDAAGVTSAYLNGQRFGTQTYTGNLNSNFFVLGRLANNINNYYLNGNLSNVRFVKGSAVYDPTQTTITVPTAPLTAISGTQLLTCQSSTFIDNSPNAFAITVNGDSYTGTLNNPFGSPVNYTTPPPNGYSMYFNGVNENTYVSVPISITFGLTSNHVIEFDYFCDNLADNSAGSSISSQVPFTFGSFTTYLNLGIDVNGQIGGNYRADSISNAFTSANGVIGAQQWYRIRWQKIGTAMALFVNNVQVTPTVTITAGALTFTSVALGRFFYNAGSGFNGWSVGKMANLTITQNGVPLLDTFRSPYLRDFSSNNYVITLNGVCSTVPLSPTMPTSAYNAVSMGGSAYFDGTGDYLTLANSAFLQLGSNSFTVEGWFYFSTFVAVDPLYVLNSAASYAALRLQRDTASTISVYISNNGSSWANQITNIGSFAPSTWNHIAVTREGTTGLIRVYQNGTLIGSGTNASALHAGTVNYINAIQSGGVPGIGYSKYISGFRVLIGRNLYPSSFTPPVAPPTNILLTNFLANFTAAGIYDSVGNNPIETVGNVQVSTAVKKFGETSMFFDGSGDYLVIPTTNAPCQFGTADFTIEAWIYSTSIANQQMILSNRIAATGTTNFGLQIYQSKVRMGNQNVDYLVGAITLSSNTWYHVAVSRISGTFRLFINGVLDVASVSAQTMSSNAITVCGGDGTYSPTSYPFIGYIQDLRISKVGRYSGAFTPPAAAFAYNQYDIGNQQWTPTNISVTAGIDKDNLVDSPSDFGTDTGLGGQVRGNYATWNPLKNSTTLSNGNLSSVNTSTSQWLGVSGTFGMTSGQWYWECTPIVGATAIVGLANSSYNTGGHPGADANSWGYYSANGFKYFNNSGSSYGTSYTANDVIGVAFDADAGTLTFYKNGVSQGVAFSGLTSGPYFPACGVLNSQNININAGQRAFSYTAPAGFKCLVSTNLPTVNGIGATSSTRADDYFNANIWTGNGTQIPVGFDPSLIWYKATNSVSGAGWVDQIRGDNYYMQTYNTLDSTLISGLLTTNSTGFVPGSAFASNTYVGYSWRGADTLSWSFDGSLERTATMTIASPCVVTLASNGFSPGQAVRFTTTGALPTGIVAGTTYYAGNMVGSTFNLYDTEANAITGGATGRVNTSGSQSGTQTCEHAARISANPTSGFSVTQYIGVGGTTTVPHGLGAAPEMCIIKCASTTGNWLVLTTALDGSVDYAYFNGQQNLANVSAGFATLPTSTVVSLGIDPDANTNGVTYMLYSYVSIPGFSKFGVYTGNGAPDGPMIYTNFSPEMLILKRVTGTPIDSWYMLDAPRSPYNVVSNFLGVNSDQAQGTATFVDFLSNGFKPRVASGYANASGAAYLYIAVASAPFKYSRAY